MRKHDLLLLFLLLTFTSFGQALKGRVRDQNGEPIPFAKIRVVSASYGTVANAIGLFQLEIRDSVVEIQVSAMGYQSQSFHLTIPPTGLEFDVVLQAKVVEMEEIRVESRTDRERGKEIMQQVIDKRPYFHKMAARFSCDTYCFGSLEKQIQDSIIKDSVIGKESMNLIEWRAHSYYEADHKFKDEFYAYNDFSDENAVFVGNSVSVNFDGSAEVLAPKTQVENNPYLFAGSFREVHINLFENQLQLPQICANPLVSPLAYNALIYYSFYHRNTVTDANGKMVFEIEVKPRFSQEALFEGTIFVRDSSWEPVSFDLGINAPALLMFKQMRIVGDFRNQEGHLVPTRREFIYEIREGKTRMNGSIRVMHADYKFEFDDRVRHFWQESSVFTPDAFDQDSAFWSAKRPFQLKDFEKRFIAQQDSAIAYHETAEYMRKSDSIRNRFGILDFLFDGYAHVNSFKKYEFHLNGLISQIIPFGVGGLRYRLDVDYQKEFKNAHRIRVSPKIDYGFLNRDVKGSFGGAWMFQPFRFTEVSFDVGDMYDFVSTYQNIQGTFAPGNRVRNRKVELGYSTELINGLYFRSHVLYSDRQSIDSLKYPSWVSVFGDFAKPQSFERYKIFLTTIELEYHFKQKYQLRKNKKVVLGSPWPVLNLTYKKGIPDLIGTEANFDFIEFRVHDDIQLNTLGKAELKFMVGSFIHKKDLRLIEHKFFRTSDQIFFSNPISSMQLLDTALNTSNSYLQFNFIHHFNGFFLNKIWGINRLKLEETIGGGMLYIPDANFAQVEFYVGIERRFRIKKQVFKVGLYAVTTDNTFDPASVRLKIGINNYNSFNGSWDY